MTYQLITNEALQFEMVSNDVRISHQGDTYVIELLYRPPGHTKAKWTPSIKSEALDEVRRIAKAMVSGNEAELTLVMTRRRQ